MTEGTTTVSLYGLELDVEWTEDPGDWWTPPDCDWRFARTPDMECIVDRDAFVAGLLGDEDLIDLMILDEDETRLPTDAGELDALVSRACSRWTDDIDYAVWANVRVGA